MPAPTNSAKLSTVLGMANCIDKFVPGLAETTTPVRTLMKKDVEEQSIPANERSYYECQNASLLQPSEGNHSSGGRVSARAGKANRLSMHQSHVIAFGCERFHHYIYGKATTVESDHKTLQSILKKPPPSAPPRLQRTMLRLQKYDVNVIYRPGTNIPVADTLSRQFLKTSDCEENSFNLQDWSIL